MRTASVLKGCTTIQPSTPPSPDVVKMTDLLSGFSLDAIATSPLSSLSPLSPLSPCEYPCAQEFL
eukprot:scaffold166696_cov31-Tisochrysis_lutea.AAC.8